MNNILYNKKDIVRFRGDLGALYNKTGVVTEVEKNYEFNYYRVFFKDVGVTNQGASVVCREDELVFDAICNSKLWKVLA